MVLSLASRFIGGTERRRPASKFDTGFAAAYWECLGLAGEPAAGLKMAGRRFKRRHPSACG